MPERKIFVLIVEAANNYDRNAIATQATSLCQLLAEGWVLDSSMYQSAGRPQPLRLENSVVYHLVKYSKKELEKMAKPTGPIVVSIKKVPHDEADALLKKGYILKENYAKDVVLVKYEGPKTETKKK